MPDILIRGMDKPQSCNACMFDVYGLCLINKYLEAEDELTHDCPLVELPEHGDLIDRDKLSFVCGGTTPMGMDYVRRYIVDGMPVIVPTNKEDDE